MFVTAGDSFSNRFPWYCESSSVFVAFYFASQSFLVNSYLDVSLFFFLPLYPVSFQN